MHHLRDFLGDIYGVATGLGVWLVGAMHESLALQWAGFGLGLGMFGLGLSREVRAWTRPGRD